MKRAKKLFVLFLCAVTLFSVFVLPVSADSGPKPSVRVSFVNMPDAECYGTLLSKRGSNGPYFAWDGIEGTEYIYNSEIDKTIWRKFVDYIDKDGYKFLQIGWKVSDSNELAWTYYPPSEFKILLYFPETDTYAVSGAYDRYAFDAYFTVDMAGVGVGSVTTDAGVKESIVATHSYQWGNEIFGLFARILITIAIEMLIALLFGFRNKKQLLSLVVANTTTQVFLNTLLNTVNYFSGGFMMLLYYFLFEIAVFALEAFVYCKIMNRFTDRHRRKAYYIWYAWLANTISFIAGLCLATITPGIF